jgi:hypothetical protein
MDHLRILGWANKHLEILKAEIITFENKKPYPLVGDPDSTTGEYVMRFPDTEIESFPDDWGFQIGDILHNIRVALDYLTFSIVKPPSTDEDLIVATQFPIVTSPEGQKAWPSVADRRIRTVSPVVRDAFEKLQPYHGPSGSQYHPLFILNTLENVHKHRKLLITGFGNVSIHSVGWGTRNFEIIGYTFRSSFNKGDEVTRLRLLNPSDTEPNHQFNLPLCVCFDREGPARGLPVRVILESIHDYTRDVVFPTLEPFL